MMLCATSGITVTRACGTVRVKRFAVSAESNIASRAPTIASTGIANRRNASSEKTGSRSRRGRKCVNVSVRYSVISGVSRASTPEEPRSGAFPTVRMALEQHLYQEADLLPADAAGAEQREPLDPPRLGASRSRPRPPAERRSGIAARSTPRPSRTSSSHSAYASDSSGGRDGAKSPGSPMMSMAYTGKCFAHIVASPIHIAALAPEPWNNSSGGASVGTACEDECLTSAGGHPQAIGVHRPVRERLLEAPQDLPSAGLGLVDHDSPSIPSSGADGECTKIPACRGTLRSPSFAWAQLATRTRPARPRCSAAACHRSKCRGQQQFTVGNAIARRPAFKAHTSPPDNRDTSPLRGESSHSIAEASNSARARRSSIARRKNDRVESASESRSNRQHRPFRRKRTRCRGSRKAERRFGALPRDRHPAARRGHARCVRTVPKPGRAAPRRAARHWGGRAPPRCR